jgi:hypothetical protein
MMASVWLCGGSASAAGGCLKLMLEPRPKRAVGRFHPARPAARRPGGVQRVVPPLAVDGMVAAGFVAIAIPTGMNMG